MTRTRSLFAAALLALAVPAAIAGCGGDAAATRTRRRSSTRPSTTTRRSPAACWTSASTSPQGDQGSFNASLERPVPGRPRRSHGGPAARPDGVGKRRGRRSEHRLQRRADGHRGQRLRQLPGPGLRGRNRHVQQLKDSIEASAGQQPTAQSGDAASSFQRGLRAGARGAGRRPVRLRLRPQRLVHQPRQRGHRGPRRDLGRPRHRRRRRRPDRHRPGRHRARRCQARRRRSTRRRSTSSRRRSATPASTSTAARTTTSSASWTSTSRSTRRRSRARRRSPVDSVDFGLSIAISDVNEEQTIEAPSGAKPLDDLLSQFGLVGRRPARRRPRWSRRPRPRRPRRQRRWRRRRRQRRLPPVRRGRGQRPAGGRQVPGPALGPRRISMSSESPGHAGALVFVPGLRPSS